LTSVEISKYQLPSNWTLDIKMPGSLFQELNEHAPTRRASGPRREITVPCVDVIPYPLLFGEEYFEISDEAAWVVSSYKRGHSVPELRHPGIDNYWQTNGSLPHLLTLYFNRLTPISHLCIYVDTHVDGSYSPKTLSIRRGTQLCDMVENVLVHLESYKGWAVIPLRTCENPRWIMPQKVLTRSSDVERWFIRMERAAMVQYHMDDAMEDVLSAMEVEETDDYDKEYGDYLKRLLSKAFSQLKAHADDILLQQFKAGICQDVITFTILRSVPDSFEKAVQIAARNELMINHVTASTESALAVMTSADARKQTSGHEDETTGEEAAIHAEHLSDIDKLAMNVKELQAGEIDATTKTEVVSQSVLKPAIRLEAASGAELPVTKAYVMEIIISDTLRVQHTVIWVKGLSHQFLSNILFTKPIAVAPVGMKSASSRSQVLVTMEQMPPKEQEAGDGCQLTLSKIIKQFSGVLATSDEDLG
ncbi:Anaphase-promoting complex subunit 10, partial [Trichinella zimbabwensis]